MRSATLDTWLPEQVAFIQSMGNEKANSYWEAELPPNYDRVGIENFIRAKYEEKRWVPRDGKWKSPPKNRDDKAENLSEDRTDLKANIVKESVPASRTNIPSPTKEPEQVSHFHLEKKQIIPKQSSDTLFPLLKLKKGKHGRDRDEEIQYNPAKHLP